MAQAQEIMAKNRLGKNIARLMRTKKKEVNGKERPISQDDLARAIGIKRQTLGTYIRGESSPDAATLESIADYFNISVNDLLDREQNKYDENTTLLLKCSEYTGLSMDAIGALHLIPGHARSISQIYDSGSILFDAINEYLFPKMELKEGVEAQICELDEHGKIHLMCEFPDLDKKPPLLITTSGTYSLNRDALDMLRIMEILSLLREIKSESHKKDNQKQSIGGECDDNEYE